MPPHIRAARPDDVETITHLIRQLADYERLSEEVQATPPMIRDALFPETGPPAAHAVLADLDGRTVGFALYFFNFSTFLGRPGLYLEDLFVEPAFRGRGVGKALLLHLVGLAHARGCGRMEWAVLDWNSSAIAFYESLGATRMREWQLCRLTSDRLASLATR